MAIKVATQEIIQGGGFAFTWTGLENGDYGTTIAVPGLPDKTVHFYGTQGTSPSLTVYGSNDPASLNTNPTTGTSWVALTDPQGNALTKTATPAIEAILENPRYIAVACTAGTGTSANITITCKGP